ncbi:Hypothetical Protein FCC1311_109202 [Hondaea fermentalgiana]|uniref:Uncharacterized protein n=1 Tax=Hondaea fermentalgiana TaxID=2315210 RepID=A0A2R5GY21_9STRA|nr:Hypothetical Protein FCC1311_109202 [Hondaea fermentalgiana]|eukprot:GBG34698.1 Hypothetical Protein FCC1311_109202 [Hondaea fermentalgiana]
MGTKTVATVAVASAAVAGGAARMLLYPQFVLGVSLVTISVLLKLSRNAMGVALLALATLTAAVLTVVFSEQIGRVLRRFLPRIASAAKSQAQAGQQAIAENLKATPPWVFTLVGFSLPAVAQFLGSMGTVRMLSSVDVRPTSLPGASFVAVFSLVYLGTLTLGVSRTWLKPSKISFLLQSFWVLGALFSSSASELRFNEHLPSVLAGWGGFFIGLTPGTAIVAALKTAAASAALAGTGVATVKGVQAGVAFVRTVSGAKATPSSAADVIDDDDNNDDEDEGDADSARRSSLREDEEVLAEREIAATRPSLWDVAARWESWLDIDAWRMWAEENLSVNVFRGHSTRASEWASTNLLRRKRVSRRASHRSSRASSAPLAEIAPQDVEAEAEDIKEDLDDTGFEVATLAPPMQLAALVTLFRATPTCLTLTIAVLSSIVSAAMGNFKLGMLAVPVVLAPFALGELVTLARQIGLRSLLRGGMLSSEYQAKLANEYGDGMSLLLWQSPTLLKAWKSVTSWSETLQQEKLLEELADAPRQFLNPDEDTVKATPPLSGWILAQLVLSIALDIGGASSYAVPGLGELTDFAWAPIQTYLVHQMYGVTWLSWISFAEELLPFTDVLPSATIGFLLTYGQYIPAWTKRGWHRAVSKLPTLRTGTDGGSLFALDSIFGGVKGKRRSHGEKRLSSSKGRSSKGGGYDVVGAGETSQTSRRRSAAPSAASAENPQDL